MSRRFPLLAAALVACGVTPEPQPDPDPDVEPDTEDAPTPEPEVCDDGVDNDLDGLVDCEDADCADVCTEVCYSGADDDGDGLVDCYDDDCLGDPACAGHVAYELSLRLDGEDASLFFLWGPALPFAPEGGLFARFVLEGAPQGASGADFSCSGALGSDGMFVPDAGACEGCDARFVSRPATSSASWGAPVWEAPCPVPTNAFPRAVLGLSLGEARISRWTEGAWASQYPSPTYAAASYSGGYGFAYFSGFSQAEPVVWTTGLPPQ